MVKVMRSIPVDSFESMQRHRVNWYVIGVGAIILGLFILWAMLGGMPKENVWHDGTELPYQFSSDNNPGAKICGVYNIRGSMMFIGVAFKYYRIDEVIKPGWFPFSAFTTSDIDQGAPISWAYPPEIPDLLFEAKEAGRR
jgi:hypothetical protein